MIVTIANSLIRRAKKEANPRAYLEDILDVKLTAVMTQGGAITGTTVNGKTLTLQVIPGASIADVMTAAELALSSLEAGLDKVPRQTLAVIR